MAMNHQEMVFRYGEDQSSIGIVTTPAAAANRRDDLPIAVIFNSGLLHRSEPYRLNVLIARKLAPIGITTLRVDLAGKGDSPMRAGVTNRDSVAIDWAAIRQELIGTFGERPFVLMGICSGADNAIRLGMADDQVVGLVLMDAICPTVPGFTKRKVVSKLMDPRFWGRLPRRVVRELLNVSEAPQEEEKPDLRDTPYPEELVACMQNMVNRNGHILAVFSSYAENYYNLQGQMTSAMAIEGLEKICREIWWPYVMHSYPVQKHRNQLVDTIEQWFEEKIVPTE